MSGPRPQVACNWIRAVAADAEAGRWDLCEAGPAGLQTGRGPIMQVPFTREVLNHVATIRAVEHDRDILDSSAGQKALNAAWAQVPNDLADDVCEALEWVLATFHADMVA